MRSVTARERVHVARIAGAASGLLSVRSEAAAAEEHTAAWAMAGVARVSAAARGMMSMRGDEVSELDVAAACGLCSMQNESDVDTSTAVVDGRRRGRPPKLRDKE